MLLEGFGKLCNQAGEILAEGTCQIDVEHGSITLRPLIDTPLLSREQGTLRLEMEDGSEISLTDHVIRFRLNLPGVPPGAAYRLFISEPERYRTADGEA